jgi:undecaprenyl-diphosphatase
LAALLVLLAIGASDVIGARLLKPGIGRVRPCYELQNVRLLVSCGGRHSFPSNHAANAFAAAVTLSFFYRRYSRYFFSMALLVGLSRIFVGVHYPGDVLGGFILGSLCALLLLGLQQKLLLK